MAMAFRSSVYVGLGIGHRVHTGFALLNSSKLLYQQSFKRRNNIAWVQSQRFCSIKNKNKNANANAKKNRSQNRSHNKKDAAAENSENIKDVRLSALYPKLYTSNPFTKITFSDVGKYLETPDAENIICEGLCGETEMEFSATGKSYIQIREQTVTLLQKLESFAPTSTSQQSKVEKKGNNNHERMNLEPMILVEGMRGCGKSTLLNAVVLYARENGWLVMFARNPRDWISEKYGFVLGTETGAAVVRSQITTDRFGQPNLAVSLLKDIQKAHGDKLQNLEQKREYLHQLYQREKEGKIEKKLTTIIERGLKFPIHASNCLFDLRMELGLVSEYPVLIVCDQFNSLYWPTPYWYQGNQVTSEQLLTTSTFRCLDEDGNIRHDYKIRNGTILCATTKSFDSPFLGKAAEEYTPFYRNSTLYEPFNDNQDLKPESRKAFKSSRGISLRMKNLDREEFKNSLKHYEQALNSGFPPLTEHESEFLNVLTQGNPKKA
mmetsp:Transcript_5692/g.7446  ORF Transcript_5692/g.7446 Transcript_5692/m.7446 type:complete len:492 (+) Transcript_5692:101-1576(+)